jgi:hypothetical protein
LTVVSRDEALRIAREECERRQLPFVDPVRVVRRLLTVEVWTKGDAIGGNVVVTINRRSRQVTRVWVNPK